MVDLTIITDYSFLGQPDQTEEAIRSKFASILASVMAETHLSTQQLFSFETCPPTFIFAVNMV